MSMIYSLVQLSEDKLTILMERPELIRPLLGVPDRPSKRAAKSAVLLSLGAIGGPPEEPPISSFHNDGLPKTNLEKAWHGLHFLLTESDWGGDLPNAYLMHGGAPVGKIKIGYAPARALRPAEVREFDDFLQSVTPEFLTARFAPERILELAVYPFVLSSEASEDDLRYLLAYFEDLRAFVHDAATHGRGVITYMC